MLAVLSGDFIGSGDWSPGDLDRAHHALAAQADRVADWAGGSTAYTRNRGDGWQIVLHRPEMDLRAALAMRAALRAEGKTFATRIAIARGEGEVPGRDLNRAHGPAFTRAGHALDAMEDEITMVQTSDGAHGAATLFADALSIGWTPAQARALVPMLAPDPPTHAEVAKALGISRSAVSQALAAADYDHVARALDAYEADG